MIFSLDVRRARKGDCSLLHFGSEDNPGLVLIDGGPAQVYQPHLKPRLAEIRKGRRIAEGSALPLDLLMVSHIDDDHINGILEMTRELIDASGARQPLPIKIRSLWHNAFDDVLGNSPKSLVASVQASFGTASLTDDVDTEGFDSHTAKVLASVGQGIRLRDDARLLKLKINPQFADELILADGSAPIDMGKGLSFSVVGPMKAEVSALQKEHDKFLKAAQKDTKAALAAFTDTSVANLSSIVVLAEAADKSIFLTGDARGDKILEGLEAANLLKPGKKLFVDILKVPHHGSDRNMKTEFFEQVVADHYVFSGNGEHGNPERETLQMLADARPADDFLIHLTYPIDEIDAGRKADWEKEQEKERKKKLNKPSVKVRENWSVKKHTLGAFFSNYPKLKKNVRVVEQGKPHTINLLDKLGY